MHQWQRAHSTLKVYTDADWAGCRESRKSTTGSCATLGTHTLKGWSKTQSFIALTSGDFEVHVAIKASAEALGVAALLKDFGYTVKGQVWGDANAALGIIHTKCLGCLFPAVIHPTIDAPIDLSSIPLQPLMV